MKIKFFIITRFNYSEDYPHLQERIEMFHRYTLPSIKNQSDQDFVYVIIGNPGIDLSGMNSIVLETPGDRTTNFQTIKKYLRENYNSYDLVVTTRVDNDDILLPNYVHNLKTIVRKVEKFPSIIEFKGYWYDKREDKFYTNTRYNGLTTSPFISLVDKGSKINSVYYCSHSRMGQHFPIIRSDCYGYIQMIHDCNWIMNRIPIGKLNGYLVKDDSKLRELIK